MDACVKPGEYKTSDGYSMRSCEMYIHVHVHVSTCNRLKTVVSSIEFNMFM